MVRFAGIFLAGFVGMLIAVGAAYAGESYARAASTAPDTSQAAADPGSDDATVAITNNCRYGVAGGWNNYLDWLNGQNLGIGWELDFSAHNNGNRIPGAEYVQVVRLRQR